MEFSKYTTYPSMSSLKKYSSLPVHIVEDHNDALYHILRAVGSKHLPFTNNLLIHLDSHPDLLIPAELKASEVFDVHVMLEKLSIENWILVSAYTGQVSSIVWIKPPWSNQIKDGEYVFSVGKQKGTDQIRVSCPILYYVSEMLFCKDEDLEDAREIHLTVCSLGYEFEAEIGEKLGALIQTHGEHYILDIDLDFFTTMNPFVEMHKTVDMYNRLRKIYSFDFLSTCDDDAIEAQTKRSDQISALRSIFTHIQNHKNDMDSLLQNVKEICSCIKDPQTKEYLIELIQDLANEYGPEVDWELVHDAGCTCDDNKHELPHHISTQEEINSLMKCTQNLIQTFPAPTMVTIARSSLDDYCPPDQVEMVQEHVCQILRKNYTVEYKLHYDKKEALL